MKIKPLQKYIDRKMVKQIENVQNEFHNRGKACSFIKASRILARRIN